MKKLALGVVALLLASVASVTILIDRRLSGGFAVGEPFPTIALPALEDGRPRSIADFRGKKVVLHVFASW